MLNLAFESECFHSAPPIPVTSISDMFPDLAKLKLSWEGSVWCVSVRFQTLSDEISFGTFAPFLSHRSS